MKKSDLIARAMPSKPASQARREAVTERLLPGESVVLQAVISRGIYWRAIAVFILALFFALFIVAELGVLLAVVAVVMMIHAIISKEILMLAVTNKRILARTGILQVDVIDMHFDKVESVELKRMLPGFLLGYSDVVLMGTGNRYLVIPFVRNGVELRKAYNEQALREKEPNI
jgi:hypothetical protein